MVPDKSRAENTQCVAPPCHLISKHSCNSSAAVLLVRTGKRKLNAATTLKAPTPATFHGFENTPVQLPVAQPQLWSAAASAHAFATGAVGVALPVVVPVHSLRRQFLVRLAVCPTMGGYRVAEPPSAHSPGTRTRFGRARGSIEATVPVLIQC